VKDEPLQLDRFWRGAPVNIGSITNHAVKRFADFRGIHAQLSNYAHPNTRSVLASSVMTDESHHVWRTAPQFRSERDRIVAYAWTVELRRPTYSPKWRGSSGPLCPK
jgi:hypothetical protein